MPLGAEVGLGLRDIVLDGTQLPLPYGGTAPNFRPMPVLWPNGWMDYDATWYGGWPWPWRLCVRWGPT